jgi:uncharacterized protein involved in response to NO
LPLLAVALARPLIATKNRRNFVMLAVLTALFAANVVVHLDALGAVPMGSARRACLAAIDVVVFLMLVITGRVVPMFTRNATGADAQSRAPLEIATAVGAAALVAIDIASPDSKLSAAAAGVVAIIAVARAARWQSHRTARHPLVWILHTGYAWIPFALVLRATPLFGATIWSSLATHALTAGAIGSLTLGMMARVALGHTGRSLVLARAMPWAFAAVTFAAVARVLLPLVAIAWHFVALIAAGALWTIAFATYAAVYAPILCAPRVDGKDG